MHAGALVGASGLCWRHVLVGPDFGLLIARLVHNSRVAAYIIRRALGTALILLALSGVVFQAKYESRAEARPSSI